MFLLPLLLLRSQDADSQITTQFKGLAVKAQSRLLEDAAGSAPTGPTDSMDGPSSSSSSYRPRLAQEVATSILEPCDVRVVLKASTAVQDVALDVSALQLRMSPDVMQLLLHLHKVGCRAVRGYCQAACASRQPCCKDCGASYLAQLSTNSWRLLKSRVYKTLCCTITKLHVALHFPAPCAQVVWEPLAVPPADQPLVRVDCFGCLWSSHSLPDCAGTAGLSYATAGAGGVDVVGSDKGVTVWRPQPPVGYAILGDVLSSGGWRCVGIGTTNAARPALSTASSHCA
jgi:hypothetical protein